MSDCRMSTMLEDRPNLKTRSGRPQRPGERSARLVSFAVVASAVAALVLFSVVGMLLWGGPSRAAPRVLLYLNESGSFHASGEYRYNFTITVADHGLTANSLKFKITTSSGVGLAVSFVVNLVDASGVVRASYNSSLPGWTFGTGTAVFVGEVFSVLSSQALSGSHLEPILQIGPSIDTTAFLIS
jgi:hypothetical protein